MKGKDYRIGKIGYNAELITMPQLLSIDDPSDR
jgi:hypothetical protein